MNLQHIRLQLWITLTCPAVDAAARLTIRGDAAQAIRLIKGNPISLPDTNDLNGITFGIFHPSGAQWGRFEKIMRGADALNPLRD